MCNERAAVFRLNVAGNRVVSAACTLGDGIASGMNSLDVTVQRDQVPLRYAVDAQDRGHWGVVANGSDTPSLADAIASLQSVHFDSSTPGKDSKHTVDDL